MRNVSKKNVIYEYYVEGKTEEIFIKVLHNELDLIQAGKIKRFNVVQEQLKNSHLINLKKNTIIVLVFDTDTCSTDILNSNIKFLEKKSYIKEVIILPQVNNFEDELCRCCNISNKIESLINCKSPKDFKSEFIKCKNLKEHLIRTNFDISKMWITKPKSSFSDLQSGIKKILK